MTVYEDLAKSLAAYIRKSDDELSEQLSLYGFIESNFSVEVANEFEEKLTEAFEKHRDEIISSIDVDGTVEDILTSVLAIADDDTARCELRDIILAELFNLLEGLTSSYMLSVDPDVGFDMFTDRTTDWIASWSEELADLMSLNTDEGLNHIMTNALKDGKSVADVTDKLMDWYGFSRNRAHTTALTEMLTAHSAAAQEAFRQSPVVEKKKWRHTGSHKNEPRPNHVAMDGQVVPKNEPFELVGADGAMYYPAFPRDPVLPASERVNCHCISQAVVNNDTMGLSAEERQALRDQAIADDNGLWEKELAAQSKSKADIDEDTVHLDWIRAKSKDGQIKYWGGDKSGKQRWALIESGIIQNDADLERLYKTGPKGVKVRKPLKELHADGIITVPNTALRHATEGDYIVPSKLYPLGRPRSGGHGQSGMDKLDSMGIKYEVEKTFPNGVRIGGIDNHRNPQKALGTDGQVWFPSSWSDDDILLAGTVIANDGATGKQRFGDYNGIRIGIYVDDDGLPTTIFPAYEQPDE